MSIILYILIIIAFACFLLLLSLDISAIKKKTIRHLPEDPLSASERRKQRKKDEQKSRKAKLSKNSKTAKKKPASKKKVLKKVVKKKPTANRPSAKISSYEKAKINRQRKKR